MAERQLPEPSHASFLQLNINTRFSKSFISQKVSFANPSDCSDGLESLNVVFDTGEKKAEWEEAFTKAKEKLEVSESLSRRRQITKNNFFESLHRRAKRLPPPISSL